MSPEEGNHLLFMIYEQAEQSNGQSDMKIRRHASLPLSNGHR